MGKKILSNSKMEINFKKKNNFEKRKEEALNITKKYPDRVPIIVEKYHDCKLNNIDKCKYLVPKDMTMGQFIYIIRKRIELESSQSLFVSINGLLVATSESISTIYETKKDEDGFLYIVYTSENTFG